LHQFGVYTTPEPKGSETTRERESRSKADGEQVLLHAPARQNDRRFNGAKAVYQEAADPVR
jgi:hypothetical protein